MNKEINIKLNNKQIQATEGESILDVAKREGVIIPTLCHDPRLEPYSSCYLCVVEVSGMRGHQPSCSTKVTEGMEIITDNDEIHKSRKTALDLLVSNHYADCAAPCKETCPAGVDVQGYISLIDKGMYSEAVKLIKEVNPLPAICGRVCVRPCEDACRRNLLDEKSPVGIDYMKRFAADYDLDHNHYIPEVKESTGKKIAVIGAGPGGLTAAYYLQQEGNQVDIYEGKEHAGGWLRYGIPEYRLPNDLLDKEVSTITELGANIFYNKRLGDDISYKEIKEKYDATVLTIGSQKGTLLGVDGEDAEGVYSGVEFLNEMEMSGKKPDFSGKTVVVVGGGNTAMDCIRTSQRLGAKRTVIVYRRTEKEMPANPIEIHESKLEGIEYMILTNPTQVNKDENGKLKSITLIKMKLGEPDSSGRRRPMPVECSEFDMDVDYILAAIGQKTDINFINDINGNADDGELIINKWGDIDANPKTLQTGIKSVFAAGDGVTGAATLIEAIAQANIAVHSVKQFLNGEEIKPKQKEFLSKKENFKKQVADDYAGCFAPQERQEMPVLSEELRMNFNEVELGYAGESVVKEEAQRCLECGCIEYFDCELKEHSTTYGAEQKKFKGDFGDFKIDFSHQYIEIDSNKCILCSRCIRMCSEVVGANALGLINRGFDTYVAPAMGDSLTHTNCVSCGMCIETCPTGAISENYKFKPGPVKLQKETTICNYCSVGCELEINHRNGFVMKITAGNGIINKEQVCKRGKFGYQYLNNPNRILKPLYKENGEWKQISFDKAFDIIKEKITAVSPDENMFFAGARMSNEELYMVQKLARGGVKTNNIASLHYMGRGFGYHLNNIGNAKFTEIKDASKIYYLGSEIKGVPSFYINNARNKQNVQVELVTNNLQEDAKLRADKVTEISSYYYFVKAVNHYILSHGLENAMFIKDRTNGFEDYKYALLNEDYSKLVQKSGVACPENIIKFAKGYNNEINAILLFSEEELSANTSFELYNLALITGKLSKTANGLIAIKEKNNSHGIIDMGICHKYGIAMQSFDNTEFVEKLKSVWGVNELANPVKINPFEAIETGKFKNVFVFGEDPIGTGLNKDKTDDWFNVDFLVVQDSFMTETAKMADLILPSSFTIENDGSYTNSQKVIQQFFAGLNSKIEKTTLEQLIELNDKFGFNGVTDAQDVMNEIVQLLPVNKETSIFNIEYTEKDNNNKLFAFGVDYLEKLFSEE